MMFNYRKKLFKYSKLHILFFFYSLMTIISKLIASQNGFSILSLILYVSLLTLLFVYAFFWQKVLEILPVSSAYSQKGVVIFWVMLWSILFFGESISLNNVVGGTIIALGIYLVGDNE